jgi:adenosylmethionine-8-amino-7-oxononanoate aminotransferase
MQDQSQRSDSIQVTAEGWSHSDFSRVPYDVFTREDIYQAHYSDDRAKMFFHSSSYTANPIACAAAAANIAIWEDEPVLARVTDLAARQAERLAALEGVRNARALGTIAAVDLGTEAAAYLSTLGPRLLAFFRERDLLLRPLGNTVYVMPPYCIEDADLDAIYAAIGDAATTVARRT